MLKKILIIVKKISFGFIALYIFNLLLSSLNIIIPINIITIGTVSLLGIPGLLSLLTLFFITK